MKILPSLLLLLIVAFHQAPAQGLQLSTIPAPTSVKAGATTNLTAVLSTQNLDLSTILTYQRPLVRLYISGSCVSNGTVSVTFVTSKETSVWDNAADSLLVLTATATNGTFSTSDYANLAGVKYLGVAKIVNGAAAGITALSIKAVANP